MSMKTVKIIRTHTSPEGTFGELYIDGKFFCVTGELPKDSDNDGNINERNYECIPTGKYLVHPRGGEQSSKFKYDHYIVSNVPNRSYILLHRGNYCGSVKDGYKTDVEGCILLGKDFARDNKQRIVTASKDTFTRFVKAIGKNNFNLVVEERF